jgi:hypothetical protein
MPTDTKDSPRPLRQLPDRPNLRHLKAQARDLLKAGDAKSTAEAQFKIARLYGFASWPKLKAHVDSLEEVGQLKQAIDTNDLDRVKTLMTRNPELHRAPLGYGKDGPLTWVAECRVPWEPPGPARLAMAEWMIQNGSDVHQGGDGPLFRAALNGYRIPMMELLVSHGADLNAWWRGWFPIIFSACEAVDPAALGWLLEHGADPNCGDPMVARAAGKQHPGTALDYVIASYHRSPYQLAACIEILLEAGGITKYDEPAVLGLLRGRLDLVSGHLDAHPSIIDKRFPGLDFGASGGRRLTLDGATLLHVAAEYSDVDAAILLLERGADVNARATVDANGVGGQTAIFHAVTRYGDGGLEVARLLIERGADLAIRVRLPGDYERPDEVVECTPLGYSLRFPGAGGRTVTLLREHGAIE